MDRRDFLKLFALGAAGLYVPTRSYFFMPRTKAWSVRIPVLREPEDQAVWWENRSDAPCYFDQITVQVLVDLRTNLIKSYSPPARLLGHHSPLRLEKLIGRKIIP